MTQRRGFHIAEDLNLINAAARAPNYDPLRSVSQTQGHRFLWSNRTETFRTQDIVRHARGLSAHQPALRWFISQQKKSAAKEKFPLVAMLLRLQSEEGRLPAQNDVITQLHLKCASVAGADFMSRIRVPTMLLLLIVGN